MERIRIEFCRRCGQMQHMEDSLDVSKRTRIIRVGCAACQQPEEYAEHVLDMNTSYMLEIETKMTGGDADADTDQDGL